MLAAVAVFAVVGLAGFAVLDGVLRARERSEGRLERLADMQRTMYLIASDLEQTASDPLLSDGDVLTFRRYAASAPGGELTVRYDVDRGVLRRTLGESAPQRLLADVAEVRWTVLSRAGAWSAPPRPTDTAGEPPRAIAVDLVLSPDAEPPTGELRRVVELPASP
jgi:general secretion pathway protein J